MDELRNYVTPTISSNSINNIHLCVYSIQQDGKHPFVKYLFVDHGYNLFTLPTITLKTLLNKDSLLSQAHLYISTILQLNIKENHSIIFNGFYEYNHDLYLFYDITDYARSNILDSTTYLHNATFAIMDEIANHKHIGPIPIDDKISTFFINNHFLFLPNHPIEEPIVAYVSKPTIQKAHFSSIFRESAQTKSAILGPFYYFTNYENAIKQGSHVVRFALFMGRTKFIEDFPNDPMDDSDIKYQRLHDPSLDIMKERVTMRISDHAGKWSSEYDSVSLGRLELDDGSYLDNAPFYVVKQYDQQIPL